MREKIRKFLISLFIAFFLPAISGCTSRHLIIDRAIVRNETPGIITDVKVIHEPTGKSGAVNMILPNKTFELGFAGQPMFGKHAIITWKDYEGHLRKFVTPLPKNRDAKGKGNNYILVYTIQTKGDVSIHLENSD